MERRLRRYSWDGLVGLHEKIFVKEECAMSEMAFARKASGLVRGLSLVDAFGVGFMN